MDNPIWLAPEVMRNKADEYSTKSDIYSFGIILWEIFERSIPFAEYNITWTSVLEEKIMKGLRPTISKVH